MASLEVQRDEPLTPGGRLFLRPEMDQIIHCIIGCKDPIDVDAVKSEFSNSIMVKHPRFSSLLLRDRHGSEHWRKTLVDIDRHVIVVRHPVGDGVAGDGDDDGAVNDYVADLAVSTPLAVDKPLWEIHLLMAQKCAVLRIHHALADGVSLISMLLAVCRRADEPEKKPTIFPASNPARRKDYWRVWRLAKTVWLTLIFVVKFVLRALWLRDRKTALSGGAGVELWPRKLVTAKFRLDDMQAVKNAVANATINDVLIGVISSGLSRYLDIRSSKAPQEDIQITGMGMVNLRKQRVQEISDLMRGDPESRWGNQIGVILLPVYYQKCCSDALQYVKRAKAMLDQKKMSLEAQFSYKIGDLVMSWFGPKVACWLYYGIVCSTTFTISNMVGPKDVITLAGNPLSYIRVTGSSLPTVHHRVFLPVVRIPRHHSLTVLHSSNTILLMFLLQI